MMQETKRPLPLVQGARWWRWGLLALVLVVRSGKWTLTEA